MATYDGSNNASISNTENRNRVVRRNSTTDDNHLLNTSLDDGNNEPLPREEVPKEKVINCLGFENLSLNHASSLGNSVSRAIFNEGNSRRASDHAKQKEYLEIKKSIIHDGKEVADLIVGCHRGLDFFKSYYDEWAVNRTQSIALLEQLAEVITTSSKKSDTVRKVLEKLSFVERAGDAVPNPQVSLITRIATAVAGAIARLFGSSYSPKDLEAKQLEIRQTFQKDIDTSSMVYIYGVQCCTQFEETRQFIKEFYQKIQLEDLNVIMNDNDVLEFLNEISEYNPSNISVFYRRLRLAYETLIRNSRSYESQAFVRVFKEVPASVEVINLLPWKFDSDGFDNSIVQNAWDDFFDLFRNDGNATIDEFLRQIQNCIFFLGKERTIVERSVLSLLKEKM